MMSGTGVFFAILRTFVPGVLTMDVDRWRGSP